MPTITMTVDAKSVRDSEADYNELFEKVREYSEISVVVSLNLPVEFRPEGELANPEAVERQREMIASSQESLEAELQGYKMSVYAIYKAVPSIAMTVDEEALSALVASSLVMNVQEDIPE